MKRVRRTGAALRLNTPADEDAATGRPNLFGAERRQCPNELGRPESIRKGAGGPAANYEQHDV